MEARAPRAAGADAPTPTWLRGSAGFSAAALPSPQREPSGGEGPFCPTFLLPHTAAFATEGAEGTEERGAHRIPGRRGPRRPWGQSRGESGVRAAARGGGTGREDRGGGAAGFLRPPTEPRAPRERPGMAPRTAAPPPARAAPQRQRCRIPSPAQPSPAQRGRPPAPSRGQRRQRGQARPGPSAGTRPAAPRSPRPPPSREGRRPGAPAAPWGRPDRDVRHRPGRPSPPPAPSPGPVPRCNADVPGATPRALPGASGDGRRPERVPCGCGRGRAAAGCGRWRQAGCPPLRPEPALTPRILPRLRGGAARAGTGTAARGRPRAAAGAGGGTCTHARRGREARDNPPASARPHRPAPGSPPRSAPAGADLVAYLRQVNPRQALPLRAPLRDPARRALRWTDGRMDRRTRPRRGQPRRRAGASQVRVPLARGGRRQGHAAPRRSAPGALRRSSRGGGRCGGAERGARRPRLGPPRRRQLRPSSAPPASARPRPRPRAAAPLAAAWSSRRLPRAAPRRGGLEQPGPPRPAARTAEPQPPARPPPPPRRRAAGPPPAAPGSGLRAAGRDQARAPARRRTRLRLPRHAGAGLRRRAPRAAAAPGAPHSPPGATALPRIRSGRGRRGRERCAQFELAIGPVDAPAEPSRGVGARPQLRSARLHPRGTQLPASCPCPAGPRARTAKPRF
ncbi:basic proline-rich protein-like [Melospiza georgiana]|uniref:basic proline-rich protein-like n=1 Tax=Melospiza georgiana TaxID=44398 RepID=UPI0025AB84FB|nr:basic proline-rich protein-like [Melospiza georgiana]